MGGPPKHANMELEETLMDIYDTAQHLDKRHLGEHQFLGARETL